MSTEGVSPRYDTIDSWPAEDIVTALYESQLASIAALRPALPFIAATAQAVAERIAIRGRLIYVGAGTSGRISAQDGAELPPTFDWDDARVVFLIAGGHGALVKAVEGAEDDAARAREEVKALQVSRDDVVIGVAASGTTPYTCAAIDLARGLGALTVGIANNRHSPLLKLAEHSILADTGPEVVAGSTRLKAGTAQKVALNLLSTAVMIQLKRVYRGLMVDMRASNEKLRKRAVQMMQRLTGKPLPVIEAALAATGGRVKPAVLIAEGASVNETRDLLAATAGDLRRALELLSNRRLSEAMGEIESEGF